MRALRLMTVLGLSIGSCALAAPTAGACVLDSFGGGGAAGLGSTPDKPLRPYDPVGYTIGAIGTDESPGGSPWTIDAGGTDVASGRAEPDSGHQWKGAGEFQMPPLGATTGQVTITVRFTDSGMSDQFRVWYDGTPAAAAPPSPAPADTTAPPAGTTGRQPASAPATASPVARPPARTRVVPRPRRVARPAPQARVRTHAVAVPVRPRVSAPAPAVEQAAPEAARIVRGGRHTAARHRVAAPVVHAMPRQLVDGPAAAAQRPAEPQLSAARAPRSRGTTALLVAGGVLLVVLLLGGIGLAAVALRGRAPVLPEPPDHLAEMEAELQEILAEERLRAGERC